MSSKTVEVSEEKTHILLVDRVCFYDYPNLNGVMLPSEGALEAAQTLVGMPVYAKYRVNSQGLPTFGSHEAYIDEDGDIAFGTDMIGTHLSVEIKDDVVNVGNELKTLPCLFATLKIPTRKKNIVAAIKRLYSEGKLHNSWEVVSSEYSFSNNIKTLSLYEYEGNCLLGYEYSDPAYGESAKVISLSNKENELMIAEAFSQDLLSDINITEEQEDKNLNKKKTNEVSEELPVDNVSSSVSDTSETNSGSTVEKNNNTGTAVETSALTEWDLRKAIQKACREKMSGEWCWIAFHFPVDKKVWVEYDGRESELDFKLFTYEVSGDIVTVSDPTDVKLTVSIAEVNKTISEKNEALIEANNTIASLTKEVENLSPFKEAFEKAETERLETEKQGQVAQLKEYVQNANCFSDEEINSDEITTLISNLNKTELQALIADKIVSNLFITKNSKKEKASKSVEIPAKPSLVVDEETVDYSAIMKSFLQK